MKEVDTGTGTQCTDEIVQMRSLAVGVFAKMALSCKEKDVPFSVVMPHCGEASATPLGQGNEMVS